MNWIDKTVEKPNELSGRLLLVFTPNVHYTYRIVRADMWKTLIDATHWLYLSEPGEKDLCRLIRGHSL